MQRHYTNTPRQYRPGAPRRQSPVFQRAPLLDAWGRGHRGYAPTKLAYERLQAAKREAQRIADEASRAAWRASLGLDSHAGVWDAE